MNIVRKMFLLLLILLLSLCFSACAPTTEAPDTHPAAAEVPDAATAPADSPQEEQAEPVIHSEGEQPPAAADKADEPDPAAAVAEGREQPAEQPPAASDTVPSIEPAGANAEEPVVLTIKGDGVSRESAWTLSQLQSLREGYREITYSATNNWPTYSHIEAQGISLPYLLRQAGVLDSAASFKLCAADGYYAVITYSQMFGERYSYANHSAAGSSGAAAVEALVSWAWGENGKARPEDLRPFFGQSGPYEVNTASFVKNLCQIEVSTASAGAWAVPTASIAGGSSVPPGTELELKHDNLDGVRIYYTMDGSEPNYNSPVYNPSTSGFQPQLIQPLILTQSVTVKAFAAAYGKDKSPIATFTYTVE